jgi:transcription initiation factor TFIIH subunit 1
VPIIRTLNSLSEKIMANVAPADRAASAPVGKLDDGTYDELQLRDLRGDEAQNHILLNIRDQNRFFSAAKLAEDEQKRSVEQQDPEKILQDLCSTLARDFRDDGSAPLGKLVDPEEDDEEEDSKTSSRMQRHLASKQILDVIKDRRTQAQVSASSDTYGLSAALYDRLTLTHATTTEFLHQFWQAFLSGNPDRAGEVASLVESLNRAMDRINAVAQDAEAERQVEVNKVKQHAREVLQATKKKLRVNLDSIPGGEQAVKRLLGPTIRALETALTRYKEALADETKNIDPSNT